MATISNDVPESYREWIYNKNWQWMFWNSFTMTDAWSITSIQVKHLYNWVWFWTNVTCNVFSTSSWVPDWSALWSKVVVLPYASDYTLTFTFDTPISVNSWTMYAFALTDTHIHSLSIWNWNTFANWTWVKYTPWSGWATDENDVAWFTITYTPFIWPANLKTINWLAKSNIKTINWLAISSIKTFNWLN